MVPGILMVLVLFTFTPGKSTFVYDRFKLAGGPGAWEGRLEIYGGQSSIGWRTVAISGFGMNDAKVVCRMLGYQRTLGFVGWRRNNDGLGQLFLRNINCHGDEPDLRDCSSSPWYEIGWYSPDVIIHCLKEGTDPVKGVRLIGGTGPYEGTIQINVNGAWGTICDDDFDIYDANVICRMAGYPRALQAFERAYFRQANGSTMLSNLKCTGHETTIDDCGSSGWFRSTCDHREDAGVACLGNKREQTVQDVRLIGGSSPYEGTIQLNINGVWGTVCDDDFDIHDANVICRMAGYSSALQAFQKSHFGQGNGSIMLSNLHCTGHETNVDNCGSGGWFNTNCDHVEDAGVACLGNQRNETVQGVRLVGGKGPFEGTIELDINGVWGTVCDDDFDIHDGNVICRMAGYPRAIHTFEQAYFGQGKDSIMLSNLDCSGFEDSLESCNSAGWFKHNCDHSEDAGVECLGSNRSHTVEGVKLVGGAWPWEGRVELLVNGKWGTICHDNFDVNDAKVICTMAGYSPTGHIQAFVNNHFGHGKGDILLNNLQCQGIETNIENCTSAGWYNHNCGHNEDVGVSCLDSVAAIG